MIAPKSSLSLITILKNSFYSKVHNYLDITGCPSEEEATIALFLKDPKYEVQQEYRFVVRVPFHSPSKDSFRFNVSEELKKFMSPILYYASRALLRKWQ